MKIRSFLFALCFCFQALFSQREFSTPVFSITLPDGWILISSETADFLRREMNFAIRFPVPTKKYDFIIQRRSGDTLFAAPYIGIQRNITARMTKNELQSFNSALFTLDPQSNYLWGFRDTLIEVFIPTEEGTINLYCHTTALDLKKNKDVYKRIINSVFIEPQYQYKENALRDLPVIGSILYEKNSFNRIIIVVLVIAAIGIFVRKKRSVEK